ncbi:MAG: glycosyltransferase [Thermoproteota archaeon]
MNILSIAWECPYGWYGGLGKVLSMLLESIDEKHRFYHVCTQGDFYGFKRVKNNGFAVREYNTAISKGDFVGLMEGVPLSESASKFFGEVDTALGHDVHSAYPLLVSKENGIPFGFFIHTPATFGDKTLETVAMMEAKKIFVNSYLTKANIYINNAAYNKDFISKIDSKIKVVYFPPPVPEHFLDYNKDIKNQEKAMPIVTILTRYQANKDPFIVIKALDELKREGLRFALIMIGRGVSIWNYDKMFSVLLPQGIKDNVDEMTKYGVLVQSDLVISPSYIENYGVVPLESIALDTPAVFSKKTGVAEVMPYGAVSIPVVTEKNGEKKYETGEFEELKAYLRALIKDKGERDDLIRKQKEQPIIKKKWSEVAEEIIAEL